MKESSNNFLFAQQARMFWCWYWLSHGQDTLCKWATLFSAFYWNISVKKYLKLYSNFTINPFVDFWKVTATHLAHFDPFLLQLEDVLFLSGESTNQWQKSTHICVGLIRPAENWVEKTKLSQSYPTNQNISTILTIIINGLFKLACFMRAQMHAQATSVRLENKVYFEN